MPQNTTRLPTEADRRHVQEILDRHAREKPESIRRVDVKFGEDWTGHPAVYVNLFVGKDLNPTKEKIRELNDYVKIVHDDIIDEGLEFWPYSRTFEE
jgi:hypothetical protein